jgi:hypothetical protein
VGRKSEPVAAIILLLIWVVPCGLVRAQPPGGGQPRHKLEVKSTRERWFSMSPEDRQVFRRNAERWMQMSPQERSLMRERERLHQERLKREADAALRDAGLRLDQEKRELFEQRYLQERRKIERSLQQEVETKRQQQLPALNDRLRREFQPPSVSTTSSSAPALPAAPKK